MHIVDSHCHLNMIDLAPYDGNLAQVIEQASQVGVKNLLCVAVDLESHTTLVKIAEQFKHIHISVGLHPNELPGQPLNVTLMQTQVQHEKVVALGETGLDYFRSDGDLSWQQERFVQHIEIAKAQNLPLIIHSREAKKDTIEMLRSNHAEVCGGVIHCFTEDWEMAKQALDLDFYISFSGIVTFKNALDIQDAAKKVPLDKILIETDSPYLAPVPKRGKPNVPANVLHVAEFISKLRNEPLEEICHKTTENYFRLFSKVS